ncbi:hypothetical protein Glove_86g171 [Diversispora epigaea]|uniref:Uncharacterized protein n=1 Tax=Diversispora epigaea TaxID=1348612 RepID=A0A397J6U1_9GLOM|nr:hypothetical protein Glove_86g171 [Diversispora epigaea]
MRQVTILFSLIKIFLDEIKYFFFKLLVKNINEANHHENIIRFYVVSTDPSTEKYYLYYLVLQLHFAN